MFAAAMPAAAAARVAIVGAGIAGLSAASKLAQMSSSGGAARPLDIWLLEQAEQPGGWVRTAQKSDSLYELGPRTIRGSAPSRKYLLDMVRLAGLDNELVALPTSHPAAARRLIAVNNQLTTIGQLLTRNLVWSRPPFRRSLIGWAASQLLSRGSWPPKPLPAGVDQQLDEYARARLGPDLTDFLLDPLTRGIYAGRLTDLGIAAAFPHLVEAERQHGNLLLGLLSPAKTVPDPLLGNSCAVWSLQRGLGSLAGACVDWLRDSAGVRCLFNAGVHSIRELPDGRLGLRFQTTATPAANEVEPFDHVILCVPAYSAARIWPERLGHLAPDKSKLHWVSLAIVSLLYRENIIPQPAFGHLVPSGASAGQPAILGVVYDSCLFPDRQPGGATRLTCMLGGGWYSSIAGLGSDGLIRLAADHVIACLGPNTGQPIDADCRLLPDCIPQYPVGHVGRVASWRAELLEAGVPASLAGASYDGVSVPDCAKSGAEQAADCLRRLRL